MRQKMLVCIVVALAVMFGFLTWRMANGLFRSVLKLVIVVSELISILFWLYDPFVYILSHLLPQGRKTKNPIVPPTPGKLNRFAVIGCAHNEETVIGMLVESVFATSYPKNMYDIYVICDNCTDGTADAVRRSGGIAMERHDERRGVAAVLYADANVRPGE